MRVRALLAFVVFVVLAASSCGKSSSDGGDGDSASGGGGTGGSDNDCTDEAAALWDFKSRNDACETSDDCVTEYVGCDVTEDDCTGAVYYAADFDRAEFEALRDEYRDCAGMCAACRRLASPPGCVSGRCQILPTR